jgi:PAS domain S-box-containing protein
MLVKYPLAEKDKLTNEHIAYLKDYNNKKVLACSKKLEIDGVDWYLITKINRGEAFKNFFAKAFTSVVVILILLTGIFVLGRGFGHVISAKIRKIYNALIQLYQGEKSTELDPGNHDELGDTVDAYNKLRKRINDVAAFAIEMSEGNFSHEFQTLSEKDDLGNSLNILKKKMIQSRDEHDERAQEDEIRNWINTGVAKFNDLLRQNNDNIKELAFNLVENLVEYLDANQGGIFLVEGEKKEDKKINLIAGYAYDRRKYNQKTVEIGEGLLGNVYLEKLPVYLKEIPDDYIEITSGLGQSKPKCLYIMPLKVDDDVLGMIEIASLNEFEDKHIEFITKVSESIAATFVSVRLNMQTSVLLEESNRKAEEIAQQEEEMRQNLEEMQATQEEVARLRQEDEKRTQDMQLIVDNTRRMLRDMLDSIPGGYALKDQNGVVHLINKEGAEFYGLPVEKIIGKTDHELLDANVYKNEHNLDVKTIESGEQQYDEEVEVKGKKKKYRVIKKPFEIAEINQTGVLTIRNVLDK